MVRSLVLLAHVLDRRLPLVDLGLVCKTDLTVPDTPAFAYFTALTLRENAEVGAADDVVARACSGTFRMISRLGIMPEKIGTPPTFACRAPKW